MESVDKMIDMGLVLVVEDEFEIASILEGFLKQSGYRTERAADGEAAMTLFWASQPDLILLDINLPSRNGVEVLKAIRQESDTPIIMLTARAEELDKLLGLELGADDYITKPFRPMEVMARVKAVLRRSQGKLSREEGPVRVGPIEIDLSQGIAKIDEHMLELTTTEFKLLYHFASYPGKVFNRNDLLEAVMPESDALERVVDVHIGNVRRKLAVYGYHDLIQTVRGMGFRLAVQ